MTTFSETFNGKTRDLNYLPALQKMWEPILTFDICVTGRPQDHHDFHGDLIRRLDKTLNFKALKVVTSSFCYYCGFSEPKDESTESYVSWSSRSVSNMAFNMQPKRRPSGVYTVSNQPISKEIVFRNPHELTHSKFKNIMYDYRVLAGNSSSESPTPTKYKYVRLRLKPEVHKRAVARREAREQQVRYLKIPDPLKPRPYVEVETDPHLLEWCVIVEDEDVDSQTDTYRPKSPSPPLIPAKTGKDFEAQSELFDFDFEVQPVVAVITCKTIEQSLMEVMEEEELACLRAQQKAFLNRQAGEAAKVRRLQERDRCFREAKGQTVAQQRELLDREQEAADKIAARAYTLQYLGDLCPMAFGWLTTNGYFYDPVEREMETNLFPWLMARVNENLERRYLARLMLDTVIYRVAYI